MPDTPAIPYDEINADMKLRDDARRAGRQVVDIANPSEINKEVALALARHVSPDDIGRTIARLLGATRMLKNGVTELPDSRAQEAGVKLWLAYSIGLPVQRSEVVNVNLGVEESDQLEERLAKSPALRRALARMLAKHEDVQTPV